MKEERCGRLTYRKNRCDRLKRECIYHNKDRRLSQYAINKVKREGINRRRTRCGARRTGHNSGRKTCIKETDDRTGVCLYHRYTTEEALKEVEDNRNKIAILDDIRECQRRCRRKQIYPRRSLKPRKLDL